MSSRACRLVVLLCVVGSELAAQLPAEQKSAQRPLFVNDEWERYARVQQIAGDAPLYPWTVRTFTTRESRLLGASSGAHAWSRVPASEAVTTARVVRVAPVDPEFRVVINSGFPFGFNDGPVWTGRGLTTAISGGFHADAGPIALTVSPLAFRAENAPFTMRPNGVSGTLVFADAFAPLSIDRPQRFGDAAYQRFVPGDTRIELDVPWLAAGFSTAAQHWGPARDHPLVLGNNAGGYPHAFLGTASPVNVLIGRLHTRLTWGKLDASEYSVMRETGPRYRFAPAIVLSIQPAGVAGLELGFSRFFHIGWTDSVLSADNILRPFIGIVRKYRRTSDDPLGNEPDNQIASIFGRWVFPASGVEVYAEFAKDDYNGDFRDLAMQPDHLSGYLLGFQRVLKSDRRYRVIRGELLNTRISSLALTRPQAPFYVHSNLNQGHTHDGQVLGSAAAFGGGAFGIGVDDYSEGGRQSVNITRMMRAEYRASSTEMPIPRRADILYAAGLDGIRFRGRMALTWELTAVYEVNRDFRKDAMNLRGSTGVRFTW